MRSFVLLSIIAAVGAQNFKPSNLHFTPGTDKVDAKCIPVADVGGNDCPAAPDSGNIMVHAWHQVIDERTPDKDVDAASNGASVGIYNVILTEVRTLAIFPDFPESGRGKQCKMHFYTNGGANLASNYVTRIGVWSLKPGKDANLETTWNTRPDRDQKVAAFDQTLPYKDVRPAKYDHIGVEGPAFPREDTFPCPTPGSTIAWELAMDTPESTWNETEPQRMFAGGMNGFALEIIGAKQTAYGPSAQSSATVTPTTLVKQVSGSVTPTGTANGAVGPAVVSTAMPQSGAGSHAGGLTNGTASAAPSPSIEMSTGAGSAVKPVMGFLGTAAMVAFMFI